MDPLIPTSTFIEKVRITEYLPDDCLIDGVQYQAGQDNPHYIDTYTPLLYQYRTRCCPSKYIRLSYVRGQLGCSVVKNYGSQHRCPAR